MRGHPKLFQPEDMRFRAIPFVGSPAIARKRLIQRLHLSVSRYFGQNRGRRNRARTAIAADNRTGRKRPFSKPIAIDQNMMRRADLRRQSLHRARHGSVSRL